jgi:hypothetical protein
VQKLAVRALKAELHIVGRERIAVVKLQPFAQLELEHAQVGTGRSRLGQARALQISGQRLHQRIVERVEDPERGELSDRLARSNHCAEMVTYTAQRISPSGFVWAAARWA